MRKTSAELRRRAAPFALKNSERYAGLWLALRSGGAFIASGDDAYKLYRTAKKQHPREIPFIYKVPRKDEGPYVL